MSVRTLRYWLAAEWWREVEDEASAHEAAELVRLSVESLKAHLPEDARLALRVLERLDPRFQPVQRHAVQAVDGFHVDLRVAGES